MPLLEVNDLSIRFQTRNGVARAVNGVDFSVERGEIVGLVGESGSGKSVTCASLMGLLPSPPAHVDAGRALFDGIDLLSCSQAQARSLRGRRIAMIFQDPMTALNPTMRIGEQVMEPLLIHGRVSRREALRRAGGMLEAVGIPDVSRRLRQYPHEFSGGMRQRAMIAMALIGHPELLIADEPTTALDVTIQAQIIDLIRARQRESGMAVIYITHDLGVVASLCHRVNVMYAGRIVESAPVRTLFANPLHPYTHALRRSLPSANERGSVLPTIPGTPPDPSNLPPGCPFAPRCEHANESCRSGSAPALIEVSAGHRHACPRSARGEINL